MKKYCSKCDKLVTDIMSNTVIGMGIRITGIDLRTKVGKLTQKSLGRYYRQGKTLEWNFCYECLLNALMGRGK